jgi:hypothetical protein
MYNAVLQTVAFVLVNVGVSAYILSFVGASHVSLPFSRKTSFQLVYSQRNAGIFSWHLNTR